MTTAISQVLASIPGAVILATVAEQNPGSRGVLLKNGFEIVPGSLHHLDYPVNKGGDRRAQYKYRKQT